METLLIVLPFVAVYLTARVIYERYKIKKNGGKIKVSKLRQYWLDSYLRLIFVERVNLRPSIITVIFYIPLLFTIVFGPLSFLVYLQGFSYPDLPLKKMETMNGTIKSITLRRKMTDLLVLTAENGKDVSFSIRAYKDELKTLPNKEVKIWYQTGWSSVFSIDDIIKEITIKNKSIRPYPYKYDGALNSREGLDTFIKYCFYIGLISGLIIWFPNRKELPIHRLNRMKRYKKKKNGI